MLDEIDSSTLRQLPSFCSFIVEYLKSTHCSLSLLIDTLSFPSKTTTYDLEGLKWIIAVGIFQGNSVSKYLLLKFYFRGFTSRFGEAIDDPTSASKYRALTRYNNQSV